MKLCKDCRHVHAESYGGRKRKTRISEVSGKAEWFGIARCDSERAWGWLNCRIFNNCGKEARFWEPKEPQDE